MSQTISTTPVTAKTVTAKTLNSTSGSPSTVKAQPKAKPRKFSTAAKTMVTIASVGAFMGSWSLIGHLQADKTQATNAANGNVATITSAAQANANIVSDIPPLVIPTVAPLPALDATLASAGAPANNATLPSVTDLAPLPTLAPLPALAPLPQVSVNNVASSSSLRSGGS